MSHVSPPPCAILIQAQRVRHRCLANAPQNLGRRPWHDGPQQHGSDAHGFGDLEEHLVETARIARLLRQRPRGRLRDELIGGVNDLKGRRRAVMQREAVHGDPVPRERRVGHLGQPPPPAGRDEARPSVLLSHGCQPADEIAEVVGQVDVVTLLVALPREVAIPTVCDFLYEVQTQRIGSEPVRHVGGIEAGTERFTHALAAKVHPPVSIHLRRQCDAGTHQHRWPHHGVETCDVLADNMQVGRPTGIESRRISAVTDGRRVVDQGIEPDVHGVVRRKW